MLKRIFLAGLALAAAGFGLPSSADAHRYGMQHHGPWSGHPGRGAGVTRSRWRGSRIAARGVIHGAAWGGARYSGWRYARPDARAGLTSAVAAQPAASAAPVAGGLVGRASFYAGGGRTASGGIVGAATCAHRSLPFGTRVLVTNLANLRHMVLTVNDRGPFVGGRVMDVSRTAAAALGMLRSGVANIRMQVIGGPG